MEELQARHRKEAKDLQSRITQKKKQASKKTRKGVNDECARLEQELKERQQSELAALNGDTDGNDNNPDDDTNAAIDEDLHNRLHELNLQKDESEASSGADPRSDTPVAALNGHNATNGTSNTPTTSAAPSAKKPNRAKARLARRAAEQEALVQEASVEAQSLPDRRAAERERMLESMAERTLAEHEVRADGHCLYSAVADQLDQLEMPVGCTLGDKPVFGWRAVRAAAAGYIEQHADDFAPFLEEPLPDYVRKVRDTAEWGGQLELIALASVFDLDINVLQDFGRVEKIEPAASAGRGNADAGERKNIWLGYYKHGFGLGEHYNSLRKIK